MSMYILCFSGVVVDNLAVSLVVWIIREFNSRQDDFFYSGSVAEKVIMRLIKIWPSFEEV